MTYEQAKTAATADERRALEQAHDQLRPTGCSPGHYAEQLGKRVVDAWMEDVRRG